MNRRERRAAAKGSMTAGSASAAAPHQAEAHARQALQLDPNHLEALLSLGNQLRGQGRGAEAFTCFAELARLQPDNPALHALCGNVLQDLGRLDEAEPYYRKACELKPDYAEIFNNLGSLLQATGRPVEAEAQFRHALSLKPNFPQACNNLAGLLLGRRRFDEAEVLCREALRLRGDYAQAHNNLASAVIERDDYEAAEVHYREAIRLKPDYAEAFHNLGSLFGRLGKLDDSIAAFRAAVRLRPDYHEAHANLGMTLAGAGQFAEGWRIYDEHREEERKDLAGPRWHGEDLNGGVLLVHDEQGLGDVIQFSRFVPQLASRTRVVLEVPRALLGWLSDLPGVDQVVARGDSMPHYDARCALLSVPRWLGTTLDDVAGETPYLFADPIRADKWRERLAGLAGLRVGLAWAGNPSLPNDRRRSIDLHRFSRLAEVAGVSFVSLQKGEAARQTSSLPPGMVVHDWTDQLYDFADTAALISELDLVISVDTSIVHVAGAMGRPIWLLNRFNSCWRWMIDRERSPWYGSLRQFQQDKPGDWDGVFDRVKAALVERVANRA